MVGGHAHHLPKRNPAGHHVLFEDVDRRQRSWRAKELDQGRAGNAAAPGLAVDGLGLYGVLPRPGDDESARHC